MGLIGLMGWVSWFAKAGQGESNPLKAGERLLRGNFGFCVWGGCLILWLMVLMPYLAAFGILVFAGMSFFFALAESALFSLGKWQVRQLAERKAAAGQLVGRLLAEPQHLLATIVLGNTMANASMLAITLASALWVQTWESSLLLLTLPALFVLILVGCEVVPKTLAVRAPEVWAARVARPMLFLLTLTRLLHQGAQRINNAILSAVIPKSVKHRSVLSDAEYEELLEMAYQQGTLAKSEKEIILQIIGLDRLTAKDVMKSRAQMAFIPDDLSMEEMIAAARKFRHSRLPFPAQWDPKLGIHVT